MRFLLGGFGSRGDVQPMVALALALRDRGHAVTFVGAPNFAPWLDELRFPFVAAGESMQELLARASGSGAQMMRAIPEALRQHFSAMEPLVPGCDVIVSSSLTIAGASLAEKYGRRYHSVWFYPQAIPSAYHCPPHWSSSARINAQTLPRWMNRLAWWIWVRGFDRFMLREPLQRERARLGLPPVADPYSHLIFQRTLLATEPSLAPLPPDVPAEQVTQTGAWFLPEPEGLSPELEAFLAAGPPPVYVGFGSMHLSDPAGTLRTVIEAVRRAGVRALVSRGWGGLGGAELPPTLLAIGPAPHGKLFPRCAAVVHHGGAGTTANAARSGVPQVIVPHIADQFYSAHRVWKLGLSPRPIPKERLDAGELAAGIRSCVEDGAMRERAAQLARGVRRDGLQRAVEVLESGERP